MMVNHLPSHGKSRCLSPRGKWPRPPQGSRGSERERGGIEEVRGRQRGGEGGGCSEAEKKRRDRERGKGGGNGGGKER